MSWKKATDANNGDPVWVNLGRVFAIMRMREPAVTRLWSGDISAVPGKPTLTNQPQSQPLVSPLYLDIAETPEELLGVAGSSSEVN